MQVSTNSTRMDVLSSPSPSTDEIKPPPPHINNFFPCLKHLQHLLGSELKHKQWQGTARASCTLRTKRDKSWQGRGTTSQYLSTSSRAGAETMARFQQELRSPGKFTTMTELLGQAWQHIAVAELETTTLTTQLRKKLNPLG